MATILPSSGTRVRYGATLLVALSLFGGWGRAAAIASQEVPTEVTSDLVDEALSHELDLPALEVVPTEPSDGAMSFLVLISVGAGLLIALGLLRADRPWEHSPWRYSTGPGDAARAEASAEEAFEDRVAEGEASRDAPFGSNGEWSARPKEQLKLPPHVLAMLERGPNTSEGDSDREPESDGELAAKDTGVDVLVPRLDPRRST